MHGYAVVKPETEIASEWLYRPCVSDEHDDKRDEEWYQRWVYGERPVEYTARRRRNFRVSAAGKVTAAADSVVCRIYRMTWHRCSSQSAR